MRSQLKNERGKFLPPPHRDLYHGRLEPLASVLPMSYSDSELKQFVYITLAFVFAGVSQIHAGNLRRRRQGFGHVRAGPDRVQSLDPSDMFGLQELEGGARVAQEVHQGSKSGRK